MLPRAARRSKGDDAGGARGVRHFTNYNFVRIHKTLRVTPAMAADVTKQLWEITDIVDVHEVWERAALAR